MHTLTDIVKSEYKKLSIWNTSIDTAVHFRGLFHLAEKTKRKALRRATMVEHPVANHTGKNTIYIGNFAS